MAVANREEQFARLTADQEKRDQEAHNAYRAIVLMSFELRKDIGLRVLHFPWFGANESEGSEIPNVLKPIIEECRRIVFGEK